MFVTDVQLKDAVKALLKRLNAERLVAYWNDLVPAANQFAFNEIQRALTSRGFTAAAIAAWDHGAEFQRDLALWKCGVDGSAHFKDNEGELLAHLDRREELLTVPVLVGGELATEGGETVSSGRMQRNDDTFSLDTTW